MVPSESVISLLHGVDYALTTLLVGSLVFSAWILPAGGAPALSLAPQWDKRVIGLLLASLFVSILWLYCMSGEMSDDWGMSSLGTVAFQTRFGHLWLIRVGVLALLISAYLFNQLSRIYWLSLSLPIFSSLTGHAGSQVVWPVFSVLTDYGHFLGVSIWGGGLVTLYLWLRARLKNTVLGHFPKDMSLKVVTRFSHFAMASTGAIAFSGLIMAYRYGIAFRAPWGTSYGVLVLVKTGFFGIALLAASINQFLHLRTWEPSREKAFSKAVCREVGFEIVVVVVTLIVAGFLARSSLPQESP